jgi:putative transposase
MSDTMDSMATEVDQQESAQQLLAQAREQGIEPVGPGGLLNRLTTNVLETALEAEMDEHLGYGKHDVGGRGSGNTRNGARTKTVLTEIGPVEIDGPRDTGSTFDRRSPGNGNEDSRVWTEIVLSLSEKGLTTGRGNRGPLRRGVPCQGVKGHDLADHRKGHRRDDRVAEPAS